MLPLQIKIPPHTKASKSQENLIKLHTSVAALRNSNPGPSPETWQFRELFYLLPAMLSRESGSIQRCLVRCHVLRDVVNFKKNRPVSVHRLLVFCCSLAPLRRIVLIRMLLLRYGHVQRFFYPLNRVRFVSKVAFLEIETKLHFL